MLALFALLQEILSTPVCPLAAVLDPLIFTGTIMGVILVMGVFALCGIAAAYYARMTQIFKRK